MVVLPRLKLIPKILLHISSSRQAYIITASRIYRGSKNLAADGSYCIKRSGSSIRILRTDFISINILTCSSRSVILRWILAQGLTRAASFQLPLSSRIDSSSRVLQNAATLDHPIAQLDQLKLFDLFVLVLVVLRFFDLPPWLIDELAWPRSCVSKMVSYRWDTVKTSISKSPLYCGLLLPWAWARVVKDSRSET